MPRLMTGQCLLKYLTIPLTVLERTLQEAFHDSALANFGIAVFSWLGIDTNGNVIRNRSCTHGDIADSIAKASAAQQRPLDSLTKGVLENRIALDYLCWGQHHLLYLHQHFNYIRSLSKPFGLKGWLLQWSLSLVGLGLGDYVSKVHARHWESSCS